MIALVDGKHKSIQSDCGDGGNVSTDDVSDLENANAEECLECI